MANFVPLGERVVVKPSELEQQTKGGIFLPDTAKEKPQEGEIVAVGPGRVADDGTRIPMELAKPNPYWGGVIGNDACNVTEAIAVIVRWHEVIDTSAG